MAIGRNRQTYCVVSRDFTESKYHETSCSSGTHSHFSWSEINELWCDGLLAPDDKGKPGFVGGRLEDRPTGEEAPDYLFEWLIVGKVIRFKRNPAVRGLSSRYGEYLAWQSTAKAPWAQVLIANMRQPRIKKSKTKLRRGRCEKMNVLEPGYIRTGTVKVSG
jgi:hypothetical protein